MSCLACCRYSRRNSRAAKSLFIRLLHAAPNTSAVDIYANEKLIIRNLPYKGFTEYFQVPAGNYHIQMFPTGEKTNSLLAANISVPAGSILTAAAVGDAPNLGVLTVSDRMMPIPPDKAYIRFVHLSPNTAGIDVASANGTKLFGGAKFKEVTNYKAADPGVYTLQLSTAGTDKIILNVPNVDIKPDRFYTAYAVGLAGGSPTLQLLIALDGSSYISPAR